MYCLGAVIVTAAMVFVTQSQLTESDLLEILDFAFILYPSFYFTTGKRGRHFCVVDEGFMNSRDTRQIVVP